MATPTSPGFPTSFPSDVFRAAIKGSMQMGAPPDPAKRAVFVKKSAGKEYFQGETQLDPTTIRKDRDGRPFDPTIRVVDIAPVVVSDADVAIEVEHANADELPVGNFRQSKAIVTALDVDYVKIAGAREMRYNGDRYLYGYEPEAPGLFDVGTHTLVFYALDET